MRRFTLLVAVAVLAVVIAGCAPQPAPMPTREPVSPIAAPTDGASEAMSPLPQPSPMPGDATSEANRGSATGFAARLDGTPMKGITIYAAFIETKNGARLAAVDPLLDVRANTDAEGHFVLSGLKPGEYAIATQSPVGVIMPHNQKGEIVLYQVKAGEATDLGRLELGYVYPDS